MEEDEIKYPNYTYDPSLGFDYNKALKADEVKNWQKVLYDGGYYGDNATDKEIDGKFGARSLAATDRWLAAQKPATSTTVDTQPSNLDSSNLDSSEQTEIKPELPDYLKNKEAFADWAGLNAKSKAVSTEQKRKALERQNYASSLADAFKLIVNAAGGSKGMYIDKIPSNPYFQRTAAMRDKLDEFDLQEEVRTRNENMMRGLRNSELFMNTKQAYDTKIQNELNQKATDTYRAEQLKFDKEKHNQDILENKLDRQSREKIAMQRSNTTGLSNEEYEARQRTLHEIKAEYAQTVDDIKSQSKANSKSIQVLNKKGEEVTLTEQEAVRIYGEIRKSEKGSQEIISITGPYNQPNTIEEMKAIVTLLGSGYVDKENRSEVTKSPITGKTSSVPAGFQ